MFRYNGPKFWVGDIPQSCCANSTTVIECMQFTTYQTGCYDAAEATIKACGTIIINIGIIILVIELLWVFVFQFLCCYICCAYVMTVADVQEWGLITPIIKE